RIPKPPMEDVLKSAIGIPTEGYLHQLYFYYPNEGGYEAVVHAFGKQVRGEIRTSCPVAEVTRSGKKWSVRTTNGESRTYDVLDYSMNVKALRDSVAATGLRLLGRLAQFDYINSDVCVERAIALSKSMRDER